MNAPVLIDALVREIAVQIARLATAGGDRAPPADVTRKLFLDLTSELEAAGEAAGLPSKVVADTFGMALRTYPDTVRRHRQCYPASRPTAREALVRYLQAKGTTSLREILDEMDVDKATVRSILNALMAGGFIDRSGRGPATRYTERAAEKTIAMDSGHYGIHRRRIPLSAAYWEIAGTYDQTTNARQLVYGRATRRR